MRRLPIFGLKRKHKQKAHSMAGRTRKKTKKPQSEIVESTIHEAAVRSVAKLQAIHADEIKEVRAESEQNIISVGFSVKIDGSEAATVVKTQIRFISAVTDSITTRMDDPNQGSFEFIDKGEDDGSYDGETPVEEKPKKGKSKKESPQTEVTETVEGSAGE